MSKKKDPTQMYCVVTTHDTRTFDTDQVMGDLAALHPSVGVSDRAQVQVFMTVPAQGVAQATTMATAAAEAAVGAPAVRVETMTEAERDAQEFGAAEVPDLVDVAQAAAELGVTRQAVLKRIQSGSLPARKVGRSYAIPATAIQ